MKRKFRPYHIGCIDNHVWFQFGKATINPILNKSFQNWKEVRTLRKARTIAKGIVDRFGGKVEIARIYVKKDGTKFERYEIWRKHDGHY